MVDLMYAPVFRSLVAPNLVFGLPRNFAIALGTLCLVMIVSLGQVWFVIPGFAIAFAGKTMASEDPYFFTIIIAILKTGDIED